MAKTKISEFSPTPANNTDIDNINIAEGCAPSGINDAIRELMAQLKDFQAGTAGDSFNGPIGTTTAVTGAFTNITASGTLGVTGVATLGNGAVLGTPASVTLTNGTGLPIATGVSGLGTGVATALAVNVGSAGAPVINGGALGTPSSGTVTNLTGTASININGTVGATTATTGAFTTLAASGAVTLSGGTANCVSYLNGSKVLTSSGNLQFDGNQLYARSGTSAFALKIESGNTTENWIAWASGAATIGSVYRGASDNSVNLTANFGPLIFGIGSAGTPSEQARLTSTGLGIGTSSPAEKLDVNGAIAIGGTKFFSKITSDSYIWNNTSALNFVSSDGNTVQMKLDSSGNLGLGVTPSAWNAGFRALQFGNIGALFVESSIAVGLSSNYVYTDTARYIASDYASRYDQLFGAHRWFTAASGTAGNAISFSQSMTLDASGNLVVGATSTPGGRLTVNRAVSGATDYTTEQFSIFNSQTGASGNQATLGFHLNNANWGPNTTFARVSAVLENGTTGATALAFGTAADGSAATAPERARIDSSGNLIQTVNTTAATLATNNTLTFSIVDNSTLRISVRGSDGTTRTATVALT